MMAFMYFFISLVLVGMLFSVSHPISMGLILISYSVIIGLYSMSFSASWFFYLLVLVFLGGVMVLIIYMSTLSSNEKFWGLGLGPSLLYFTISFCFMVSVPIFMVSSKTDVFFSSSTVLYEQSQLSSLMFLMVFLLLVMLCVVKLVKFEFGPLIKRL